MPIKGPPARSALVYKLLAKLIADCLDGQGVDLVERFDDEIQQRVDDDPRLLKLIEQGFDSRVAVAEVMKDPEIKRVLTELVQDLIDAATYMRY